MGVAAAILGCAGPDLTAWERDFFAAAQPFGFILFARNIVDPNQLRRLTRDLRDAVGRDAPILIDQEGGRVQRMRPPYWRDYLPALDQMDRARDPLRAHWLRNRLIAAELHDVGIDCNCAPLADIAEDATHAVLKNRLYGHDVDSVVAAARTCADAHLAGGVLPVLKHIPGYGRAQVDSHHDLPRVSVPRGALDRHDFAPFAALSDLAMGMTAHIVIDAIDGDAPATLSAHVIRVIRDDIGFGGLLMTDDISMNALSGTVAQRSGAAIAAGCDIVLHCNGDGGEMGDVISAAGPLSDAGQWRADRALDQRRTPEKIDIAGLEAELAAQLA